MGRGSLANGKSHVENKDETSAKQSKVGAKLGDIIWVRLRGSSWWPAQVVDEKAVSGSFKPRKGKFGEVLVRLYGTYKYTYVDPLTSNLEFKNVLKQHKGSHREIIQKGLKQDFSESQSGGAKRQSSKDKGQTERDNGNVVQEKTISSKRGSEKQDGEKKKIRLNSPSSEVTPQEFERSARRLKVMQGLGLAAPSGSPFRSNGQISSIVE